MAGSSRKPATERVEQKLFEKDYSSQQPKVSRKTQLQGIQTKKTDDTERVVGFWNKRVSTQDLLYMKKTTLIEMRPGLKEERNITFVLISREFVSHCKSFGSSFIISNYDDNKTRFIFPDTTALPIAVSTTEDVIGFLDHENEAKYDILIDFYDLTGTANNGSLLALYDVRYKHNGESVAEILIKLGQLTFKFADGVLVAYKALSIAYGINRALNIYKAYVMQPAQPPMLHAEGFLSLYEGVFPLLTVGVLRIASRGMDSGKCQLILMDINNQNKIAMIANCDHARKMLTAFDLCGNQLFQAIELVGATHVMLVSQQTRSIGKCQWDEAEDISAQLKLDNGEVFTCSAIHGYGEAYIIVDSRNNIVCKITDSGKRTKWTKMIKFLVSLQTNAKKVILSYAMKLTFEVFQREQHCVPKIKLSKISNNLDQISTFSSPSYFLDTNGEISKQHVPAGIVYHSDNWRNYTFRAAGYNIISDIRYVDVIDDEYQVYLTMEIRRDSPTKGQGTRDKGQGTLDDDSPTKGQGTRDKGHWMMTAKDEGGFTLFAAPDFRTQSMMSLYKATGNLLGYQLDKTLYGPSGKVLMTVHEEGDEYNLRDHISVVTVNGSAVAHIDESDYIPTLSVKTSIFHVECSKYLLLAYTMNLGQIFYFDKYSIPQIEYDYLGQNSDNKEY